jgi:phenylacetate-CoA ligase
LEKWEIKKNISFFETREKLKYRVYVTGGTTGEPLKFKTSINHFSIQAAYLLQGYTWGGWKPGDKMITIGGASISPKPQGIKSRFVFKFREWLENNPKLSSFDLKRETISRLMNTVQKSDAKYLRGFPSGLTEITKYLKEENITPPKYKAIFTTSEKLWRVQREMIEKYFQTKIYDQYGARDGGAVAFQCEKDNYHMFPLSAVWEIVDENDEPVSLGEEGRLILTDLHNYSTLFIRYEVGDRIRLCDDDDICECGRTFPKIKSIEGRSHDILRSPNGHAVHGEVFSHIFRNTAAHVNQFQIQQTSLDKVIVRVVSPNNEHLDISKLMELLEYNLPGVEFQIDEVDEIPLTKGGKLRFVIGLETWDDIDKRGKI